MTKIELCTDADSPFLVSNLKLATELGVHRVELCADMASQGLTPSQATVNSARKAFPNGELLVMIRPHNRGFSNTRQELTEMISAISMAADYGADGVVFGVLGETGTLDMQANGSLAETAHKLKLKSTFHRAFDAVTERTTALSQLLTLGIHRVLSSGTHWDSGKGAQAGTAQLTDFLLQSEKRIELVVGGGITPDNAPALIRALTVVPQPDSSDGRPPFSLHCFSGVLTEGKLDAEKMSHLMKVCSEG